MFRSCETLAFYNSGDNHDRSGEMKLVLERLIAVIGEAGAEHSYFLEPSLLLAHHAFTSAMKKAVFESFPAVALRIITEFAANTMVEVSEPPSSVPAGPAKKALGDMSMKELMDEVSAAGPTHIAATKDFESKSQFSDYVKELRRCPVARSPLPGPPPSAISAEWLKMLREKVLFSRMSSAEGGTGKEEQGGKGSSNGGGGDGFFLVWLKMSFKNDWLETATPGGPNWTNEHYSALIAEILAVSKLCREVCKPLALEDKPLEETMTRIEAAGISLSRATVAAKWREALDSAKLVYGKVDPIHRTLSEQTSFYDELVKMQQSPSRCESALEACTLTAGGGGAPSAEASKVAVVKVLVQAKELERSARETTPNIEHHCKSAEAVLRYARDRYMPIPAVISELDGISAPFLIGRHVMYPARVGYHTITDMLNVNAFLSSTKAGNPHQALMERRLAFLTSNRTVNDGWRGGADRSLVNIFNAFRQAITPLMASGPSEAAPVLAFDALAYADPWARFHQVDIDSELREFNWAQRAEQLTTDTGLPPAEAMEQLVNADLQISFRKIDPEGTIGFSDIEARCIYTHIKKKMIYVIERSGTNFANREETNLLGLRVKEGCQGRCPDGVTHFCDEFIQEAGMLRNHLNFRGLPKHVSEIIFAVSKLVSTLKLDFVKKHLSRHSSHYEGRTAGQVVLTYMLMLPLSLPGEYGQPKYPRFAIHGHCDPAALDSTNVLQRFIHGGLVRFDYGEEVVFNALTLHNLANSLRSAICAAYSRKRPSDTVASEDLEPRQRYETNISPRIVEEFCQMDVILGPYYNEAKENGFTHANAFFNATAEDDTDVRDAIVKLMRDAAVVRLLDIAQYVKVHPNFYRNVSKTWEIPMVQSDRLSFVFAQVKQLASPDEVVRFVEDMVSGAVGSSDLCDNPQVVGAILSKIEALAVVGDSFQEACQPFWRFITTSIRANKADLVLITTVMSVIARLARTEKNVEALFQEGAIDAMMPALSTHAGNSVVAKKGCIAIWNLLSYSRLRPSVKAALLQAGAKEVVTGMVGNSSFAEDTLVDARDALTRLS